VAVVEVSELRRVIPVRAKQEAATVERLPPEVAVTLRLAGAAAAQEETIRQLAAAEAPES